MSQIAYFRIFILLLFFKISVLEAKLVKPSKNGEEKEILLINGKRRLYYPINNDGIQYLVEGPVRLEFISRYPALRKKKKSHSFNYSIVIDGKDTVAVRHRYKIQNSIRSVQHPKHKYTYSGNYFINLDRGSHTVDLIQNDEQKYPVLIRVLTKDFESVGENKKVLLPMVHQEAVKLQTGGKSISYFECSNSYPLQVEVGGRKTLRILTRLQFTDMMGQEESYRIKVKEGAKIIGTYYFNTERSSGSQIVGRMDKVPGKWRTCDIKVPKGIHRYNIEISDKGKTVLTRFIVY